MEVFGLRSDLGTSGKQRPARTVELRTAELADRGWRDDSRVTPSRIWSEPLERRAVTSVGLQ